MKYKKIRVTTLILSFILISSLVACFNIDKKGTIPKAYTTVTLEIDTPIDLALTTANFNADNLEFVELVGSRDDVLVGAEVIAKGELGIVVVSEFPFEGGFGQLVFKKKTSRESSIVVQPLNVGENSSAVVVTSKISQASSVPQSIEAQIVQKQPLDIIYTKELVNFTLGDMDASGGDISFNDIRELALILFEAKTASNHENYHGDIVQDRFIDFRDIRQLALKFFGAAPAALHIAPAALHIAPWEMQLDSENKALMLVSNSGNGALPSVNINLNPAGFVQVNDIS